MLHRATAAVAARARGGECLVSYRLKVNPIMCKAHGLCAELLPEFIDRDPWGYPIVPDEPVPHDLEDLSRRAAATCPTLALIVSKGRR